MKELIDFDEFEYTLFKVLYSVLYLSKQMGTDGIPLSCLYNLTFTLEESLLKTLFERGFVMSVGVKFMPDDYDECCDVGIFSNFSDLSKECFEKKDNSAPRFNFVGLYYLFTLDSVKAKEFVDGFLEKWQTALFVRYPETFVSPKAQVENMIQALFYELKEAAPNNFHVNEENMYLCRSRETSLVFCVLAFLHFQGLLTVFQVRYDSINDFYSFHLSVDEGFFVVLGRNSTDFWKISRSDSFWLELFSAREKKLTFRSKRLVCGDREKIFKKGFGLSLLEYAKDIGDHKVVMAAFTKERSVSEDEFRKGVDNLRSAVRKSFDWSTSEPVFPMENGVIDFGMVNFRE